MRRWFSTFPPWERATNGGAIHFGPDGDLYVGVGENAVPANAPDLSTPLGKILRLDPDGAIPLDNPFVGVAGADPRIWARGLRNPFTFGFQPGTGVMLINDVGAAAWEEVNVGHAGADYGWPATEGPTSNPIYIGPLYAYPHPDGCAIVGAAFPDPDANRLGADYFFGDLCAGFVRSLDVESATAAPFASALGSITDLAVGADGALYVADLDGRVVRIAPDGPPPVIPEAPIPILLPVGTLGAGALTLRRRRRP